MNNLLIIILFFVAFLAHALPPIDPDKPIYQKRLNLPCWPPILVEVDGAIKDPAQYAIDLKNERMRIRQEINLKELKRGSFLMYLGMIIAAAGVAFHFLSAYPIVHKIAYPVAVAGVSLTGAGMFMKKISEYQNWIVLFVTVSIVILTLYKCRFWSVSHLFKRKQPTTTKKD